MSSKEKKPMKAKETEAEITYAMPSKWGSNFAMVRERIEKLKADYITEKRGKNYADGTIKILNDLFDMINNYFKPKPPRTLQDAYDYALSRNYEGTYMALMNDKNQLVKALILNKGEIMDKIPEFHFEDKELEIKMKAHLLIIPSMNLQKSVPKSVVKAIPFASDRKTIRKYA